MKKNKIYFVTGVSTSGKSTIIPELKAKLPDKFVVYDFDEKGVPRNVNQKWRYETTQYWFNVAMNNSKKGKNTIICGYSMPDEIKEISKKYDVKSNICLLDVSSKEITKRLNKRFSTPQKVKVLKKITGETLDECINGNILEAQTIKKQCQKCKIYNTSKTTPKKTAQEIVDWIINK